VLTKTLITATAAGAVALGATPALAGDAGLYGTADPTFDGVYRQSLSILALNASDQRVPASAVRWLKKQQCSDGGFVAYRADTGAPCQTPDPINYAGQDSNSTAIAAVALLETGNRPEARRAATWLVKHRGADGGWAYYPAAGSTSDTNSTALAIGSLTAVRGPQKATYLRSVQLRCDAAKKMRGGLAFDSSLPEVNDNATSQAAWILGGGLTLPAPRPVVGTSPRLACKGTKKDKASTQQAALGYLDTRLQQVRGRLPYGGGYPGTDFAGASAATLALANAGAGRKAVKTTARFLEDSATEWITANGDDAPGALAMLILVADATGDNPRDFGGVNLVKRLAKSQA
jgi:hypothetical protein